MLLLNQLVLRGLVFGWINRERGIEMEMMHCLNCAVIHKYDRKVFGRTKKRWCFKCRVHIVHDKIIYSEVLEFDEKGILTNGWYEPFCVYECRKCHEEHLTMW